MDNFWDELVFGHKNNERYPFSSKIDHNELGHISNKVTKYEVPLALNFDEDDDYQRDIDEFEKYQLIKSRKNNKYICCKSKKKRKCCKKIIRYK
ncbi:hypothetical protein [Bacillus mycoides]|uniref:hypothetical protein n=1 Tax=Bacillus mycoides TaxID=1405 RepID=UPI0011A58C29|nr:hypothetical protein [Bacillus mycoides]